MEVGYFQYAPVLHDPEATRTLLYKKMIQIHTDLLVLPELAVSGYLFSSRSQVEACSETVPGPTSDFFSRLAEKTGTDYVYGCAEKDRSGNLYNSSVLVRKTGETEVYRKIHLFNREKLFFTAGNDGFSVSHKDDTRIGMLICFDHMFPEAARTLALNGVQIVCHPSNLVLKGLAQITTRSRAIENHVYWILANRVGTETVEGLNCTFTGCSQICAPDGTILASSSSDHEEVKIVDIEPQAADNKQITDLNNLFSDRRPEYYG